MYRQAPPITINIRHFYLGGLRPFQVRQLDTIVEALSTVLQRLHAMSEQFHEAVASLEAEIGETRTEVGRLSGVIADLLAKIEVANDAGDTAAVRAATAELNEVNIALQSVGVTAAPVEPDAIV
jgi:phage shock protein A